jgi:hypothetical protein
MHFRQPLLPQPVHDAPVVHVGLCAQQSQQE